MLMLWFSSSAIYNGVEIALKIKSSKNEPNESEMVKMKLKFPKWKKKKRCIIYAVLLGVNRIR